MRYDSINDLLVTYEETAPEELPDVEYYIFMFLYEVYEETPYQDIPDAAFMFIELDGWQGMSFRCGVWQYYENGSFEKGKLERAADYLRADGEEKWADIFSSGIHDYADEKYQIETETDTFPYPEEWLNDSDIIDDWIDENEIYISEWKRRLILSHKDEILKLAEDNKGELNYDHF
ncbi:MAG: hypothetical protein IIY35_04345 [Ruminococcus sp.]|nr:hypothetical protein [Ruminococcus sp.]